MIDLRKRLKQVLQKYGHHVIYIRRDTRFHCHCYVERSGEPTADCPNCFGTGYEVSAERILVRRSIASIPETLAGANSINQAGRFSPKSYTYYFEHNFHPKESDLILEVVWDVNNIPRQVKEKMLVSASDPQLGYKGRIEFYQVACRYDVKGDSDDKALSKY